MSKQKLEIQNTLVISTAHIKFETSKRLETLDKSSYKGLSVVSRDVGFVIFIYESEFKNNTEMSKDICNCVELALNNGCTILILDRDADTVDSLETFEW